MLRSLLALVVLSLPLRAQTARLPSREPLFVLQGGDTPNVNTHMAVRSEAFGVDFGVVGGPTGRELAPAAAQRTDAFYCWDTPVVAPVGGIVVEAVDSLPDNALGVHDTIRPLGNHVILHSGDRFYYLAHFRRGSTTVRAGETVGRGDVLGRCGNSGNSDFPHIHLHATESPRFGEGTGINLIFGPMRVTLASKTWDDVEWPMLRGLWVVAP